MIVIHHNPDCGTSRNVLGIIQAAGYEPVIVDYLKEGWTRSQLQGLLAAAGLKPSDALRKTKSPAKELGLLKENKFIFYDFIGSRCCVYDRDGFLSLAVTIFLCDISFCFCRTT